MSQNDYQNIKKEQTKKQTKKQRKKQRNKETNRQRTKQILFMKMMRSLQIWIAYVAITATTTLSFSFCNHYQKPSLFSVTTYQTHSFSNKVRGENTKKKRYMSKNEKNDADWEDDDDDEYEEEEEEMDNKVSSCNVLGTALIPCCTDVGGSGIGTGFYRNGYCSTGDQDLGRHTVCIRATDDFLEFSKSVGNDLSTPIPEYMFPGLNDGDVWCLCAQRWAQALNSGKAPDIFLQATHEKTLDYVPLDLLMNYAIDKKEAEDILNDLNEQRAKLNRMFQ